MASHAIAVAAKLRLVDTLADGPQLRDELARRVSANSAALELLLRTLISRGILRELHDGRSALTALADTLRSDVPMYRSRWRARRGISAHAREC